MSPTSRGKDDFNNLLQRVIELISKLITEIPERNEPKAAEPLARAREIIAAASLKAAAISGALALPPGPLGWITILPDLAAIWRIQAKMVADIAGAFGKKPNLTTETMMYCLFRHAASQFFRDFISRTGQRVLVQRPTARAIQLLLEKIGVKITQRIGGRGIARLLPVIGALGVAGYAYYDTGQVGQTTIEFFSSKVELSETQEADAE